MYYSLLMPSFSPRYRMIFNIVFIALISGILFRLIVKKYTVNLEKQQMMIASQASPRGRDGSIKYFHYLLKLII